jgi:hypothetical protein
LSLVTLRIASTPGHLEWPDLDVDLSLRSIDDPGAYPLVFGSQGSDTGKR